MVRSLFPSVVCLVAAVALSGCGRKGPLEPPPGVPQPQVTTPAQAARQTTLLQNQDNPGLIQSPNRVYEIPANDKLKQEVAKAPQPINEPAPPRPRSFILDPLLN